MRRNGCTFTCFMITRRLSTGWNHKWNWLRTLAFQNTS